MPSSIFHASIFNGRRMGILFGLTAALGWGVADFMATAVARRIGVMQALFYLQLIGLAAIGALALLWPAAATPTAGMWAAAIGISVINLVGTLLLYRAFTIGTLAIVAPIASGFAVVTALLALLAWAIMRERLAPAQWAGVAVILAGVLLVSL